MAKRKREQRFPDTKYFTYYNANPHNRITTDCVIRAISNAADIKYESVVMDFAKIQCDTGMDPSEKKTFGKYLESNGWLKMPEPRNIFNKKIQVSEFIDNNPGITCIAIVGSHHVAAIINGKVNDIWDSSKQTMHSYYIKGGR